MSVLPSLLVAAMPLLQQSSVLVRPIYLEPEPPEVRTLQVLFVAHEEPADERWSFDRTLEDARHLAKGLSGRARAGESFDALVARYSQDPRTGESGVLGTFAQGMLTGPMNEFLFASEEGAVSPPIELPDGIVILKRASTLAGVRQILVAGNDDAARRKASELIEELQSGADFGELAAEFSVHPESAKRGGAYAVFERGPSDSLLKRAAFTVPVGGLIGPIETPFGQHILKRVAPEEIPLELHERPWARVRTILIAHEASTGRARRADRTQEAAAQLCEELIERIQAGEDMAVLAAGFTDDPGGRARGGDVGWLHRRHPNLPHALRRAFSMRVGDLSGRLETPAGYVIVRRED